MQNLGACRLWECRCSLGGVLQKGRGRPAKAGQPGEVAAVGRKEVERVVLAAASVDRQLAETAMLRDVITNKKCFHSQRCRWTPSGKSTGQRSWEITKRRIQMITQKTSKHCWTSCMAMSGPHQHTRKAAWWCRLLCCTARRGTGPSYARSSTAWSGKPWSTLKQILYCRRSSKRHPARVASSSSMSAWTGQSTLQSTGTDAEF